MNASEIVKQAAASPGFLTTVLVLVGFLVIARFIIFVREQYIEGLTLHLSPCVDCYQPLSPQAAFCPSCGRVIDANLLASVMASKQS